jgi:hypothetical protein
MDWVTVQYNGKKKHTNNTLHSNIDIKNAGLFLISKDKDGRAIVVLLNNNGKRKWLVHNMGITLTTILEDFGGRIEPSETPNSTIVRVVKELSLGIINLSDDLVDSLIVYQKSKMISGILYMDYDNVLKLRDLYRKRVSETDKTNIPKYCLDMNDLYFIYLDTISETLKRVEIYSGQKYSEKYSLASDVDGNPVWLSYRSHGFLVDSTFLGMISDTLRDDPQYTLNHNSD